MALNRAFWACAVALPATVIVLDQLTKKWAAQLFGQPYDICKIDPNIGYQRYEYDFSPVVDWALTCNQGFSFGLGSTDSGLGRWAYTSFAFILAAFMIYVIAKSTEKFTKIGLGFLIGGAIGNGLDRLMHGAVTDFISVGDLLPWFPWIFNVADIAVNIGVAFIVLDIFLDWRREKKGQGSTEKSTDY